MMFTREASDITAVALFTDGLQKEAVDFQHRKANGEFIPQAISILRDAGTGSHHTGRTQSTADQRRNQGRPGDDRRPVYSTSTTPGTACSSG